MNDLEPKKERKMKKRRPKSEKAEKYRSKMSEERFELVFGRGMESPKRNSYYEN